ncbi:pentatricopeptide repeat (PPR) superfamily protein [Striga asiatica]|uniref:Pentatricopeptide repeat (PPR) superfamily protein n=1 Tax=Striga asiatica TaxID=4170 RepID=A0A5A7P5A7_STRAF|nr:pentatricopeptide repeat (PPR) superfamily protein [Striga asiatica]
MLISAKAPPPSSPLSIGGSGPHCVKCHVEPLICSTSYGYSGSWIKAPFELHGVFLYHGLSFRSENPFSGTSRYQWLPQRHDICISQVSVAADYSDSVPDADSSNYANHKGYHPLEDVRENKLVTVPTSAEIARTAVESNHRAMLIFPRGVHCEPHEQISWAEFQYVVDDFGDICFEVYDDQNILQDRGTVNPVTVLIGMDIACYKGRKMDLYDDNTVDFDPEDDVFFIDEYSEIEDPTKTDIWDNWEVPEKSSSTHPVYFSKCLAKAIDVEHVKMMDHPSNGVVLWGFLRPVYIDEENYIKRFFKDEKSDGYTSGGSDGNSASFSVDDKNCCRSTIYRLEIAKIELFSVYGVQACMLSSFRFSLITLSFFALCISCVISLSLLTFSFVFCFLNNVVSVQDFQYAEPDVLVHSVPSILKRFDRTGSRCNVALKDFCRKKGLYVERANLIGVDSLGIDVRVSTGTEVCTHRFSFKVRANSDCAADKQIQQLLFPKSKRKRSRTLDTPTEVDSF